MAVIIGLDTRFEIKMLEDFERRSREGIILPVGGIIGEPDMRKAFDLLLEQECIRLFDMSPMLPPNQMVMGRQFRMTDKGRARLRELRERAKIDAKV